MTSGKIAKREYVTSSDIPLKKIYWPDDIPELNPYEHLGMPGEPPYVRGAYPDMYRKQPWRIFLLTGTGPTDDIRERVEYALRQGDTGFICECDMGSWLMFDLNHPEVVKRKEDVGYFGAPIVSLRCLLQRV